MWTRTGLTQPELERKGRKVVRLSGRQILVVAQGGRMLAIANRCPHEGYPLSEGTLGPNCVLTCNWHNWKFDLASGEALVGRDPVRTYPVAVREGEIVIDLADPPAEARQARALRGLDIALADNDLPRMAREVARLERAGFEARVALRHAVSSLNERLENGMTHAHAAAADWLVLAERAPDDDSRLAAMIEPLDHLSADTMGGGAFPYPQEVLAWDEPAFVAAIEAEDEAKAVGRLRGAIAARMPFARLQPAFGEAALAHYADFGHSAIYAFKAGQLIDRLGEAVAEPVLLALTRSLVYATREDRLPEFRGYAKALAAWRGQGAEPATAADFVGLSIEAALSRAVASSGRPVREIYDALLGAAAWNLAHFDRAIEQATDNAIADNVGWLDFTHALTFANAARHICADRSALWPRALLQLALFVGRNKAYVAADEDIARWRVTDGPGFLARELGGIYDHGIAEPIIACHRVKVLLALEDELEAAPAAPWAAAMLAAVNRYLNTPMKRHHGLRTATQARDFVARES
jgi:nitrite reductase/ring-hydroxylating ferredoxin subunit